MWFCKILPGKEVCQEPCQTSGPPSLEADVQSKCNVQAWLDYKEGRQLYRPEQSINKKIDVYVKSVWNL